MNGHTVQSAADAATEIRIGDRLTRCEIESRISTGQSQRDIAMRMGLPVAAVRKYESLFTYNRRPKQLLMCSGPMHWDYVETLELHDVPQFWDGVACAFGIMALEPLLCCVDRKKLEKQGLFAYIGQDVPLTLNLQLLVAQACCPYLKTEDSYLVEIFVSETKKRRAFGPGIPRNGAYARFLGVIRAAVDASAKGDFDRYLVADRICKHLWCNRRSRIGTQIVCGRR